ncbi:hypothetical protein [Brenneria tiliae]|uniref:Uncharacterized protein n=1 Tax=Brenneria tiliae TaxID=2914984 RepID=A0ABT0MRM3_9GAMM|nr:hypothetical protein [Brenneria tiliae]MCL2892509.1 hypothetical protein [Brenneria tiliae]
MPTLKCIKDETGYWTVGEKYAAGYASCGLLSLGDDEDPESDWLAHPKDWHDGDDEEVLTYHLPGCSGEVEFIEVE